MLSHKFRCGISDSLIINNSISTPRMASPDSKDIHGIENLDCISQLPKDVIVNILSRLPLEDSARASILSKTWKNYCSFYPIVYLDHKLFALECLVSTASEGGGEPDINQIRDMFMDDVDYRLSRVGQRDLPIRKLALYVAINDSMYFLRFDKWMDLVKQITVEDLCFTKEIAYSSMENGMFKSSVILYEFPLSVLVSKGLVSAYIRGCKFGCETLVGESFSLQRLCLSWVFMDEHLLENLIRCFQGLETLVLDYCAGVIKYLQLSKFPKLKKAVIYCRVDCVDVVDTNLECFRCCYTKLVISPDACAGIRELHLDDLSVSNQPSLFKDLTATFPVLEEGNFRVMDTETLEAANNVLRKLTFSSYLQVCVKKLHVDCPNLTLLDFGTEHLSELYVNCPRLKVLRYRSGGVPDHFFCSSMPNLEESDIFVDHPSDNDTLWFVKLRAFLTPVIANTTIFRLVFSRPMAKFEPEKVEPIQVSSGYNIHLHLILSDYIQDVAPVTDGLLWIIRPTTLTVDCETYLLIKYLCENLSMKQEENNCDGQQTHPCWMHQLEDFNVEFPLNVPVTKKNLVAVPEQCRTLYWKKVRFIFHWCRN